MFGAKILALVIVVLQANLRELAREKGQIRRNTGALAPKHVMRIVSAMIAIGIFATQFRLPIAPGNPKHLGIETPIAQ